MKSLRLFVAIIHEIGNSMESYRITLAPFQLVSAAYCYSSSCSQKQLSIKLSLWKIYWNFISDVYKGQWLFRRSKYLYIPDTKLISVSLLRPLLFSKTKHIFKPKDAESSHNGRYSRSCGWTE